ncbi:flavin reductase family protein [Paraburkholderia sp. J63]|uniref:flavin reductase family protein n=1 Tax=Paraburkholderia sp. J63 TaxID=2805434 RepID=UPI002ABDC525|nr:flavin reductase family protein [Paraburkholderia sp. J63]
MNSDESPESAAGRLFTPRQFRDAMGRFATGVVAVTTEVDGLPHAMTANAFMSGSLEPPLVLVSIACTAKMHERIRAAGVFGVSVLADCQQWCSNHFAGKPSPDRQPAFERIGGVPVVEGANVQLAAELRHAYACGDHTLFVGEVRSLVTAGEATAPLLFHGGRYATLAALSH